ncbi:MAG TPA: hypothetical protein VGP07_13590, partial [Polyangia bacterium]
MVWNRLSDQFYDDPQVEELRDDLAAFCVDMWTRALSYCGRHLTDGRVPAGKLGKLSVIPVWACKYVPDLSPGTLGDELVRVGLWSR